MYNLLLEDFQQRAKIPFIYLVRNKIKDNSSLKVYSKNSSYSVILVTFSQTITYILKHVLVDTLFFSLGSLLSSKS